MEHKEIWKLIDSIKIDMKLGDNAGRSDKMFYMHLQEGLQEKNLDKIYECITAVERGCGLRTDEIICKQIERAYELDPMRLCHAIAKRQNLVDYWVLLSTCCNTEMIADFTKIEVEDVLFYYECARILLKRIHREEKCREGIVSAIRRVADTDLKLWKYWIIKTEYNVKWQRLLGDVLGKLQKEALEIYAETITLDMATPKNEIEIITAAFEAIPDAQRNFVIGVMANRIFARWADDIEQKKIQKDFQSGIIISAYSNIILYCLDEHLREDNKWKDFLVERIVSLESDLYEWYESVSQMQSIFFLDVTQIYYCLCLKKDKLKNIFDLKTIEYICKLKRIMSMYELERFKDENQSLIMKEMKDMLN